MSPWDFQIIKLSTMSKAIIAAMTVLCFAACVQEEIVNAPLSEAIAFRGAFVDNETRAVSFTENTLGGFNVWGFMNNPAASVFDGTEVEKGTEGWSYEGDERYWIPGQFYSFAALAPMGSENIEVELTTGVEAVKTLSSVTFTNESGNEDLIYSDCETTAIESGNQPVGFTFQHLLSKVKFTFANHMRNDYINVKVSDVKMTAPKMASMDLTVQNKVWNTPASYGEFNFGSIEVKARDSKCTEDLFMIPASSSYSYVITFDIELVMDGVEEVLYQARKSAVVSGVSFEAGAAYNFSTAINPDILNLENVEFTVNDVNDWNEASDLSKIAIASKLGGEVTLNEDVTSTNTIEVVRDLTIHLNGKTLKYEGDNRLFRVVDGAKLTIYGDDKDGSAVVVTSTNLTESTTAAYIATAYAGSSIEINGGHHETNGCTLYHTDGGKIVVNSGVFAATETGYVQAEKYGHDYTLNIQGTNGEIVVNGGSFYKWDPSHSKGENPVANFVAEGYATVADGDWYRVIGTIVIEIKEDATGQINNAIKQALQQWEEGEDPVEINVLLNTPITLDEIIEVPEGAKLNLYLNDQIITVNKNKAFTVYAGGTLVINGDGTVESETPATIFFSPQGGLVIQGGEFIRKRPEGYTGSSSVMFVGIKNVASSVTINGGYFDSGYYDKNADEIEEILSGTIAFKETADDIAKRGVSTDKNAIRNALKDNVMATWNTAGYGPFKIYGGTFVGANPAWGDEGCMLPTKPNYLRPWSYYQGAFLEGQEFHEDGIVIPEGYEITKGTHEDGRPTYTVTYNKTK